MEDQFIIKPNNNMALAIFTTVCCCAPFGIIAIIQANKVDSLYMAKQYNAAIFAANESKKWSYIGIAISVIIWIVYLLIFGGIAAIGGLAAFL